MDERKRPTKSTREAETNGFKTLCLCVYYVYHGLCKKLNFYWFSGMVAVLSLFFFSFVKHFNWESQSVLEQYLHILFSFPIHLNQSSKDVCFAPAGWSVEFWLQVRLCHPAVYISMNNHTPTENFTTGNSKRFKTARTDLRGDTEVVHWKKMFVSWV